MMEPRYDYNVPEELFKLIEDEFAGAKIAKRYLESKDTSIFKEWYLREVFPRRRLPTSKNDAKYPQFS